MADKSFTVPRNAYCKNEYIVSQRGSHNDYWERRRSAAEKFILGEDYFDENGDISGIREGLISKIDSTLINDLIENLITTANIERDKEQRYLNQLASMLGKNEIDFNKEYPDVGSYTAAFNIFTQGQDNIKNALDRIKQAQDKIQWGKGQLAPNISSIFSTYFSTRLKRNYEAALKSNKLKTSDPIEMWESLTRDIVRQSIIETFNIIGDSNKDFGMFGNGSQYIEIADYFLKNTKKLEEFTEQLTSKIGQNNFTELTKEIKENATTIKSNLTKGIKRAKITIPKLVEQNLKISSNTGQLGGSIEETFNEAIENTHFNVTINGNQTTVRLEGEKQRIDVIQVVAQLGIDTQQIADVIQKDTSTGMKNLEYARSKWEDILNKFTGVDDLFIMVDSAKMYSLKPKDSYFKGFEIAGKTSKLYTMEGPLTKIGVDDPLALFTLAYNTVGRNAGFLDEYDQGILKGLPEEMTVIKTLQQDIAFAAAYDMFDTYSEIGAVYDKSKPNIIHTLFLNGVYVPLSSLYERMAIAARHALQETQSGFDISDYYQVNIKVGGEIEYTGLYKDKEKVAEAWENTRQNIRNNTTYRTHLLRNFNEEIYNLINKETIDNFS